MKKRAAFVLFTMCIMAGCTLEEVTSWGESCPPRENAPEGAYLSYIGAPACTADNQDQCDVSVMANKDIGLYFRTHNCPAEFKVCAQDEGGVGFHCEKDKETVVVTECAKGQKLCQNESGENFCLDPAFIETCGAYDCNDKANNYGGKNCAEHDDLSRCELNSENKYVCRCPNGALLCNDQCINPNSAKTCGAYDCELENYGGMDCSKGNAVCSNGKCTCLGSGIWCHLDGEEESAVRCIEPQENETCNARLVDDGEETCVVSPCDEHQLCVLSGDNEYSCRQNSCISEEMLCKIEDEWQCISKLDEHNCGSCYVDCALKVESNAHGVKCVNNDEGEFVCTFECEEGFTNCGTELKPNCVSLNTFQHCGECNKACLSYEYCNEGTCETTVCKEDQCTLSGATDGEVCVNNTEHCGKNCDDCRNIHTNAACLNGECVVSGCNNGEHPFFEEGTTKIKRCDKNTADVCGPANMTVNDHTVNCLENMPEHVINRDCGEDGTCIVTDCEDGYHMSTDLKSCEGNTSSACGTGENVVNCADIENSAETACIANACYVRVCKEGYHLSEDSRACIENKPSSCATIMSSNAVNCAEAIDKSASTVCSTAGVCQVTQCLSGFHLSADHLSCEANSMQLCAPTDSDNAVDCSVDIKNSVTTSCDSGICKVSVCAANYHIVQGKSCELNTDKLCGTSDSEQIVDCTQTISHVSKAECVAGTCMVKDCADGYHPTGDNKSCAQDSATKCLVGGKEVDCNEEIQYSAETACEANTCKVTRCASDYHLSSDRKSCVPNSDTQCAPTNSTDAVNCNNRILYSVETKCISGECSVTKCDKNYHLASDKKSCVENTDTSCAAVNSSNAVNCNSDINHSAKTSCDAGVCSVSNCQDNYHLTSDSKACIVNTSEQCASSNSATTKNCNNEIQNSAKTTCDTGGICHVSDCKPEFHLSGNTSCADNSVTACAATNSASPVNCKTLIEHSVTTACTSGACTVSKCAMNYHLNTANTACVLNGETSCAPVDSSTPTDCTKIANASTVSCSDAGKCVVSACSGNYHVSADKSSCEANSKTSCGAGTSVAPGTCMTTGVAEASCPAGVCVVSNCSAGYHISSDKTKCEGNSDTKCAATNSSSIVSCKTTGVVTASCPAGVCVVSACNAGYHISSDGKSCVSNSDTSCAATTSKDAVNCTALPNAASASCNSQGACVVSECKNDTHIKPDKTACEANSNMSCAPGKSNAPKNCMTTGVLTAACTNGACTVSACAAGYHLNSDKTACVANTDTECGLSTSSTTTNCTTIANVATGGVACDKDAGKCKVTQCASGYHIKPDWSGCESNTELSCAATTSNSPKSCMTTGVKTAACTEGVCEVSACTSNKYHIKSDKTACETNSNTSCAKSTSSTPVSCMTTGVQTAACTEGVCEVSACTDNSYHIKSDMTGCTKNTDTACGLSTSSATTNCQTLSYIADASSGTCNTSTGKCKVTKCKSTYHIKSDGTGCEANTDTACGAVNATGKNCTSNTYEKVCNKTKGYCSCSADDSTVLNYDRNACVTIWCKGIPGVKVGTKQTRNYMGGTEEGCKPSECVSGYELAQQDYASICRPLTANANGKCTSLGYKNASNSSGRCLGCGNGWNSCSNAQCNSDAKYYVTGCLPLDACCGTHNSDMSSSTDYACTNCLAKGTTCNPSTGKCR